MKVECLGGPANGEFHDAESSWGILCVAIIKPFTIEDVFGPGDDPSICKPSPVAEYQIHSRYPVAFYIGVKG